MLAMPLAECGFHFWLYKSQPKRFNKTFLLEICRWSTDHFHPQIFLYVALCLKGCVDIFHYIHHLAFSQEKYFSKDVRCSGVAVFMSDHLNSTPVKIRVVWLGDEIRRWWPQIPVKRDLVEKGVAGLVISNSPSGDLREMNATLMFTIALNIYNSPVDERSNMLDI